MIITNYFASLRKSPKCKVCYRRCWGVDVDHRTCNTRNYWKSDHTAYTP